jgi:uncharacterized protein (DUF697 family)
VATARPLDDDENTGLAKAGEKLVEQLLNVGIDGFGPFKSAQQSATEALVNRTPDEAIKALIRNHIAIAGAQGFVTNLGGFVTMPIALPANIGAAFLVQTHLAAAIAVVHGRDVHDEEVQTAVLLCLVGNMGSEVLKHFGIEVGSKLSMTAIRKIPIAVLREINRRVGFMLLAKYGTKRALIPLVKFIPLVGGFIGAGVDAATTWAVAKFADSTFCPDPELAAA